MERTDLDTAWAEVRARWEDEGAHRAFLDAVRDLGALAEVGRRYRAALEATPADPVAARWRDEVVRRATALALAQPPCTAPPRGLTARARRVLLLALVAALLAALAWAFRAAAPAGAP